MKRVSVFVALVLAAPAFAQERTPKPLEIDFDALELSAELVRPNGIAVLEPPLQRVHPKLIVLRSDFSEEMTHSVEQVR